MQSDDVAYHLGLPAQLQATARYAMDARLQVWALAPWNGDVLQGVAQVLAGREARGALNALWLLVAAGAMHGLAAVLGGDATRRYRKGCRSSGARSSSIGSTGSLTTRGSLSVTAW